MTDKTHNDENGDMSLRDELASLDWDIQPERDLWPDISSNIRFAERQQSAESHIEPQLATDNVVTSKRFNWSQVSIAACMLMACAAVVMSALSYNRSQATYDLQASYIEFQKSQIGLIEQQHEQVRAQFVALLAGQFGEIDSTTAAEIQAVLLTIDSASAELKQAILAQPTNTSYAGMLARTYQEELKLLNKFKKRNGTSI